MLARLALVIAGVVGGLACLLALELALRLVGAGEEAPAYDPFAGFSASVPLFERAERPDGTPIHRVSPARLVEAADSAPTAEREFLAEKPERGFRAFVVGGSSAAGFPYPPAYAFSAWLERRLSARFPDMEIEIVNAAMAGYSSRRALIVVRELASYDMDLLIVYSGHNEWAERRYYSWLIDMHPWLFTLRERLLTSRLFNVGSHLLQRGPERSEEALKRYLEGQKEEFDEMFAVFSRRAGGHDYATEEEIAQRDLVYRTNLDEMARAARRAGARVALLTLSQNFADWSPGASGHRPDLRPEELAEWESEVAAGRRAADAGDCRAAVRHFERALLVDDHHAGLHYRIAECRRAQGDVERARHHYQRASDLDRIPHGAPTYFNDVIREVAEARGLVLVDTAAALEEASVDGLVGDDLFVEFAHPNLRAQQVMAGAVEEGLRDAGIPRPAREWPALAWSETPREALIAEKPSLVVREHESIRFVCYVARRPDCAREQEAIIESLRSQNRRQDRAAVQD